MKVLKFGGTSVGSTESILQVKKIVEAQTEPVIVVVSALGGITDNLINMAHEAASGNSSYEAAFESIVKRHDQMIRTIIPTGTSRKRTLYRKVHALLDELKNICQGLYLLKEMSTNMEDTVVSYGERLSSLIVSTLIEGAVLYDARLFMKTEQKGGKHMLAKTETEQLVKETFQYSDSLKSEVCQSKKSVAVVPGLSLPTLLRGTSPTWDAEARTTPPPC